jgi:hypothetical protein
LTGADLFNLDLNRRDLCLDYGEGRLRVSLFDRPDKAIPGFGDRLQESRLPRVVAKCLADIHYAPGQSVIGHSRALPDAFP